MNVYNQPIVLDNGSGTIYTGYANDDHPRVAIPNIIGRPKYPKIKYISQYSINDTFIGNDAQMERGILKLKYPMSHGVIQDWESLELIWQYCFSKLSITDGLSEHPLLITEEPLNPGSNRDKFSELLFENFQLNSINIALPPILSLYSSGKTTGCVLDSGDGVTTVMPIYEGFTVPDSTIRIDIGGFDVISKLEREIYKDGYNLSKSGEFEILRNLKERLAFVDLGEHSEDKSFVLPDGKSIQISSRSLSSCTEILFDPSSIGMENDGISSILNKCVTDLDIDLRAKLFENIILSGGNTLLKNFSKRILNDLTNFDDEIKFKLYANKDRKFSTFIGGSILASLSTFKNLLVTKEEYRENPQCIHQF